MPRWRSRVRGEKVGVLFGNPETTPGGRALKFYSSVRLDVRKGEQLKSGDQVLGNKMNIKVVKNKVSPPFKTASVDILYGEGISREGEIVDLAADLNIVEKSGAWYSYKGEKIGQGRDNVRTLLKSDRALAIELENQIREHYGFKKLDGLDSKKEDIKKSK